jgi:hypothetical protein
MRKKQISTHDRLTTTLRYLYSTLDYLEVRLLAIRFQFNNETWEADTPEEAIALREKLEHSIRFPEDPFKAMDIQNKFWTHDRFMSVIENAGPQQLGMLGCIFYEPGLTSERLRELLKLDSEVALAGVISGLSKQVRQLGIEPQQLFQITVKWTGKKKIRTFILDDFFKGTAAELDWPDAWTRKRIGKQDEHSVKVVNAEETRAPKRVEDV